MQIRQNSSFILWFCFAFYLLFSFKYYEFDERANPKKKVFQSQLCIAACLSSASESDLNK